MVELEGTLIHDDVFRSYFACDLQKCKGACCVDGVAGAPLEASERAEVAVVFEAVRPLLSDAALAVIEAQGLFVWDAEHGWTTPVVAGGICVYGVMGGDGVVSCAFEQQYKAEKNDFYKPLSCHLYPVRITKTALNECLNYERITNCSAACCRGKKEQTALIDFLKTALIRKYGAAYFSALQQIKQTYFT